MVVFFLVGLAVPAGQPEQDGLQAGDRSGGPTRRARRPCPRDAAPECSSDMASARLIINIGAVPSTGLASGLHVQLPATRRPGRKPGAGAWRGCASTEPPAPAQRTCLPPARRAPLPPLPQCPITCRCSRRCGYTATSTSRWAGHCVPRRTSPLMQSTAWYHRRCRSPGAGAGKAPYPRGIRPAPADTRRVLAPPELDRTRPGATIRS